MGYTLINVKTDTHKAIKELAQLLGMTMQETTRLAVTALAQTALVREQLAAYDATPKETLEISKLARERAETKEVTEALVDAVLERFHGK